MENLAPITAVEPTASTYLRGVGAVALAMGITAVAIVVGQQIPVLGAPVTGVVLGVLASPLARRTQGWTAIVRWLGSYPLQVGVVLLGAGLSLTQVAHTGLDSLPIMLGTLAVCFTAASVIGRALKIPRDLRILIGAGTGICGASAIAAVAPTIRAKAPDVAYAISTIFAFNIAAVLTFPLLGHLLGLSQHDFGLFAGTAVNDTSSVIATATIYGAAAAQYAVIVKLTRSLMIIPVTVYLGTRAARERQDHIPSLLHYVRLVPWFLIGFLALAGIHTLGGIPGSATHSLQWLTTALITLALAAIGMQTDVAALRRTGPRPLLLGFILWVTVAATSLILQSL